MAEVSTLRATHQAMATQFEVMLCGTDRDYLENVSEEVFREIDRLEAQLSFYRDSSDITDLNARASWERVPLDPRVFRLLQQAKALSEATDGAFDITVAPLMRCWGFVGGSGQMPDEAAIEQARAVTGMHHVHLDEEDFTISFDREGVLIDLGAIGKGYAIEQAVEILRDHEVGSALIHGGTSTVYGLGSPPDDDVWRIAVHSPVDLGAESKYLGHAELRDCAVSVSAPHGKFFEVAGRRYGHVLDPRTGRPTTGCLVAVVRTPSATESDALSTALLAQGPAGKEHIVSLRPDTATLTATIADQGSVDIRISGPGITRR